MRPLAPPLDDKTHKEEFERRVLPSVNYDSIPSVPEGQNPTAIILAGQPGAGKSGVAERAKQDLGGGMNAIVVDPDAMRDFHPKVDEFRKASPYNWADDTHKDASQWAKELRDKAIGDRKNLVIDTTLGSGPKAVELVEGLQKAGYNVEIRALATHRLESELGVDARFTGSLDRNGFGRFVPPNIRDQVYQDLPANLDHVQAQTKDHPVPIRIYNREADKLYDSTVDTDRLPSQALTDAREQRIKDPTIAAKQHEAWNAQVGWHAKLEARLAPDADPKHPASDCRKPLLDERADHGIVAGVAKNASAATRNLDEVQDAARIAARAQTPSISIAPGLSVPSLASAPGSSPSSSSTSIDLSRAHPDTQALYGEIRKQLPPSVSDHKALEATVAAQKQGGIGTVDQLAKADVVGDKIVVSGKTEGFRAVVEAHKEAPPTSELLQQAPSGQTPPNAQAQQQAQQQQNPKTM
ncbi:zeta toxin family protein [Lysobacter sp. K5869]|uniref:zeta toxin family protein n=1 Tax=Lysobacter sp. K5869 TaxID=2820808 RepID=UPI001C05F90A|nr:zeta toxin family protein [Lysobacter sp. K5869]QWP74968.1 zeta toxin family protein [Lysobacter sp. K5869]